MNSMIDLTEDGHAQDEPFPAADVIDLATSEDTDDEGESHAPAVLDDKATSMIGVEISSDVVDLLADEEDTVADNASDDEGESIPPAAALDNKAKLPIGVEISAEVVDLLADDEDDEIDSDNKGETLPLAALDDKAKLPMEVKISNDVETLPPAALDDKAKLPIGVEISADVVDLLVGDDDDITDDITTYAKSEGFAMEKQSVQQSHPRKYIMASRKRKREKALQKEAEERAEAFQRKPKAADRFNPENIPGGCNFVVIDDDSSDEDELEFETSSKKQSNNTGMTADKKAALPTMQSQKGVLKEPPYRYQKKPFIKRFNPQNENMFCRDKDYNFNISQEDAFEMQERMLRESAARVARMHSSEQVKASPRNEAIVAPIFDIAERHPDHWRWKEPYACLGLPRNASMTLVKSQYR
jgi:hypothetical protein